MRFTFETQGSATYLVYRLKDDEEIDTLGLGMLTNNQIDYIAPFLFTQLDEKKFFKYNISAKVSLKEFFAGIVNKEKLLNVIYGITVSLLNAEEYMLDISSFLFDLEYIYADASKGYPLMICRPVCQNHDSEVVDMPAFFKNILINLQLDQTENDAYIGRLINYLNSNKLFSLFEFKKFVTSLKERSSDRYPAAANAVKNEVLSRNIEQPVSDFASESQSRKAQFFQGRGMSGTPWASGGISEQKLDIIDQLFVKQKESFSPKGFGLSEETEEKKISLFHLLMHYNKENKEAYTLQRQKNKDEGYKKDDDEDTKASHFHESPVGGMGGASCAKDEGYKEDDEAGIKPHSFMRSRYAWWASRHDPKNVQAKPKEKRVSKNSSGMPNMNFAIPGKVYPISQMDPPMETETSKSNKADEYIRKDKKQSVKNFGETDVLSSEPSETTVLCVETPQASLLRQRTDERIFINKPFYKIGKDKNHVDYFISDNSAVSRNHAMIFERDGCYFVKDTNSRNHTYINGVQVPAGAEMEISHNDNVRFANEDFIFKSS